MLLDEVFSSTDMIATDMKSQYYDLTYGNDYK